ncbi:MAG: hypothetical protein KatS3mg057_1105 [Herpetosiphonaceae bacterium]|nr:MAG: hypothetical protein KatS3mg057_1105 [Herpetosiphonaceae bacterium]
MGLRRTVGCAAQTRVGSAVDPRCAIPNQVVKRRSAEGTAPWGVGA